MVLRLKLLFPILLLLQLLTGCTSDSPSALKTQQLIQEHITVHYDSLKLEGYQPLSFSAIDTIAVKRNQNGDISVIIGEVTHKFKVKQGGSHKEQSQVFSVQLFEDEVVTFPAKKVPLRNERPLINI